jgi:hypothetical protein
MTNRFLASGLPPNPYPKLRNEPKPSNPGEPQGTETELIGRPLKELCVALFDLNFRFQALFNFWPFRGDDAEVDAVAQAAGPGDDVMTENSFLLGAEAQNRVARLGIERVGFPFHAIATQRFEGMAHHYVFSFRVDRSALPGFGDPGGSDLQPLVGYIDAHESCGADDFVGRAVDGGEGDRDSFLLVGERGLDIAEHLFTIQDLDGNPFPQLRVEADFAECVEMGFREWLELDVGAFQGDGLRVHFSRILACLEGRSGTYPTCWAWTRACSHY